jgi:hypothetical protein
MRPRAGRAVLGALLLLSAVLAAPALADTSLSSNWAGYAVHRTGVRFSRVIGTWHQPAVTCARGQVTYSALWIGLGGYSGSSDALEQIGTEADCTASGRQASSAWYEMVPAPSHSLSMHVHPGDAMSASVSVSGHTTTLTLSDTTRHEATTKRVTRTDLDTSSAEWIVEAPSECTASGACQTLPLANFGQTGFALASARQGGRSGAISDRRWGATKIMLQTGGGRRFVGSQSPATAASATPSPLLTAGSAFTVSYSGSALSGPFYGRVASVLTPHPGDQHAAP